MQKLAWNTVYDTIVKLPDAVLDVLKTHGNTLALSGGFIRAVAAGEVPNDIDLWSTGLVSADEAAAVYRLARPLAKMSKTKQAISFVEPGQPVVQFIYRWFFAAREDLISSFDFTCCQAAIWFDDASPGEWSSVCREGFYDACLLKKLVYTSPVRDEEPAGSLMRVLKYNSRGWSIDADSFAKVIQRATAGVGGMFAPKNALAERIKAAACHY